MSDRNIKNLREKVEKAKEDLKCLSKLNKDSRAEIRRATNNIKKLNIEIGNLDSKSGNEVKSLVENSSLTSEEIELYDKVFTKIATSELFQIFSTKEKESHDRMSQISIDVQFQDSKVSFFIGKWLKFHDLRIKVADYWSLPLDEIFFSDEDPSIGAQSLFMLDSYIMEEIYVWNKIKLRDSNFLLYLVLRDYTSLQERMEQIFPKAESPEIITTQNQESNPSFFTNKRQKKNKHKDKIESIKSKKKIYNIQYMAQFFLSLSLFLLWGFLLVTDIGIEESAWVNNILENEFLYPFRYDSGSNTAYTNFTSVSSIDKFWSYLEYTKEIFYSGNTPGLVYNGIYVANYIQLRQLRTELKQCYDPNIGNYTCTTDYSWVKPSYKSSIGSYSFQRYSEFSQGFYLYGILSVYPLSGYAAELPVADLNEWESIVAQLQSVNWIDEGTRAIFITMNFFAPSPRVISMLIPVFEISSSGIFVQNFKIYSLQDALFSNTRLTIHILIFIVSLFLLILSIRNLFRIPEEYKYYKLKDDTKFDYKTLQDKLDENLKKKFFKRIHKPKFGDLLGILCVISALIIEISNLSWYFSIYKSYIDYVHSYADLYERLQGYGMTNDARAILILFLACNLMRYYSRFLSKYSEAFVVLLECFKMFYYYVILCFLPLFVFSVHYFFFLGPYNPAFCLFEATFVSTIRLFIGSWPTSQDFIYQLNYQYLVALQFMFLVWRMIVINYQIIIFQTKITKLQLK